MADAMDNINLCSICLRLPDCRAQGKIDGRLTKCDDFKLDLQAYKQTMNLGDGFARDANMGISENGESVSRPMGLCLFCNSRETCRLPKPEGGIWHCQDFSQ